MTDVCETSVQDCVRTTIKVNRLAQIKTERSMITKSRRMSAKKLNKKKNDCRSLYGVNFQILRFILSSKGAYFTDLIPNRHRVVDT